MRFRFLVVLAAMAGVLLTPGAARSATPATSQNVQVVGSNPLFNRGLNAAAAIFDHFLYVGNRTDGSSRCGFHDPRRTAPAPFGLDSCPHPHAGILILDIDDPSNPTVVGEIPAPLNALCKFKDLRDPTGQTTLGACEPKGVTSREARVWPDENLLVTMNFRCSSLSGAEAPNVCIAIARPEGPTYRSHPKVEACSIAIRAVTVGGSTLFRYSRSWCSNMSHDGIDTTRARIPSARSLVCASTARLTSLPEAMSMISGFPPGGSART